MTARFGSTDLPGEEAGALRRASRLEWFTIGYLVSTIVLVYLVMGSSQAMKVAWIEDMLSLIPPVAFLLAVRRARRLPDAEHPYGHHRAVGSGHLTAGVALLGMGVFLVVDSASGLIAAEHPPIGTYHLFGHTVWAGWPMVAVMAYAGVGPVLLGRRKLPLSEQLHDKVLKADADMNKADWMTAASAVVGILGIGVGLWWLDAVAALVISTSIVRDGWGNLTHALADLADGTARTHDDERVHPLVARVVQDLQALPWVADAGARVRDMGHVFHVEAFVVPVGGAELDVQRLEHVRERLVQLDWKLQDVVVVPVARIAEEFRPVG